jgi:transcriptional regulator GlxA family with amidase domain
MKQVCFLLPEGLLLPGTFFSALDVLTKANEFYVKKGREPYYDIKIVGERTRQALYNVQFMIEADHLLNNVTPDMIVIPSLNTQNDYSLRKNQKLLTWIKERHSKGCEIASLCTGAFMLAETGLLDNRECSTHWAAERLFMKRFPGVKLRVDKIITDNNGIYTAGGSNSSLNLMLYLVEKFNGREAALYCTKLLQIDIGRTSQLPFILFQGQKDHRDEAIRKVQDFIETNIDEKVTVEYLAEKFSMSKRSFIRRFKKATSSVPIEYIQKVKIEYAKRGLELHRKNINEVMYSVGYTDVKTFRTTFKKVTGFNPIEYQQKFGNSYN